jgi:serine/threonine protein kinase/uncharacterized protein YjdB
VNCTQCGANVLAADRYCPRCGAALGGAAPRAAPSIELPAPDLVLEKLRRATLGTYEIRGELGRGGMAVVYLARDLRLDRSVAIKVMLPGLFLTQGMAERFLQEARIAARLYHPNIIIVHAVEQTDDLFYFVMNLVEGAAVDEILRQRSPLAIDEVRWIMVQAARALYHAHGEGVVHRDVKPANLMVNTKGDVVVSDFGIAKVGESSHLTRTGAAIGTPAYMSPEQVMGLEIGSASDQYSLGVAAFEMLTGRAPFGGAVLQIQWAHAHEAPPSIVALRPDCPPSLAEAITRMLAKAPADRWPSLEPLVSVFGEGLPMDGGAARRGLQGTAVAIRGERGVAQPELLTRTPLSPIPTRDRSGASSGESAAAASATVVRCSPQTVTLSAGESVTVRATVTDSRGVMLSQVPVQWQSSDEQVARVSSRGEVMARRAGRVVIRAVVGTVSGESTVVVEDAPVVRLALQPTALSIRANESQRLSARALDARGDVREGTPIAWGTDDPAIATISEDGLVSGVREGRVIVRARVGAIEATAPVSVLPPAVAMVRILPETPSVEVGDETVLVAEPVDAAGVALPVRDTFWEVADARIATIDPQGVVTGRSPGRVRVRATVDGVAAERTVAVRAVPLAALTVRLSSDRVHVGDRVQLTALGRDVRGRDVGAVSLVGATLTSTTPTIATITDDGTIDAIGAGSTELRVVMAPRPGTDPVGTAPIVATLLLTVWPEPVQAITLTPDTIELEVGATTRVTPSLRSARGELLTERPVVWSSLDPAVVTVRDGVLTAVSPGTTPVRASVESAFALTQVRVTPIGVAELRLEPAGVSVFVGDATTLTAVALDRTGTRVRDAVISWRTNAPAILSVAPDGSARGLAPGTAMVVASCGSVRVTGQVTVDEVPVVSLRVYPAAGTLEVGRTAELEIEARDARGREVSTLVMWTATPSMIASVTADGTVTGRMPGTVLITASRGELRALAEFTVVSAAAPAAVVVPPPTVDAPVPVAAATQAEPRTQVEAGSRTGDVPAASRSRWPLIAGGAVVVGVAAVLLARGPSSSSVPATVPDTASQGAAPSIPPATAPSAAAPPVTTPPVESTTTPDVAPAPELPATSSVLVLRGPVRIVKGSSTTVRLQEARGRETNSIASSEARWSSSAPAVLEVSSSGVVTARAVGVATISAQVGQRAVARLTMRVSGSRADSVAAGMVVAQASPIPPVSGGRAPAPSLPATPAPGEKKPDLPAVVPTTPPRGEPAPVPVAEATASDADVERVFRAWASGLRKGSAPEALKDFFGAGSKHSVAVESTAPGAKEGGARQATASVVLTRTSFVGAPQRSRARVTAMIVGAGDAATLTRVQVAAPQDVK